MIPQVNEVRVRHYKSIDQARVCLQPFTVLVGPNGSGKSNFIESLAFVQESLAESARGLSRLGEAAVVPAAELAELAATVSRMRDDCERLRLGR